MRYYVEQFDQFWSLDRDEMYGVLLIGVRTGGHDLRPYRKLKDRPSSVRKERGKQGFYVTRNDVFLISPLDYDREDYAEALERFLVHK